MEEEVEELKAKLREMQQQLTAGREAEKLRREQVWQEGRKRCDETAQVKNGTEEYFIVRSVLTSSEYLPPNFLSLPLGSVLTLTQPGHCCSIHLLLPFSTAFRKRRELISGKRRKGKILKDGKRRKG